MKKIKPIVLAASLGVVPMAASAESTTITNAELSATTCFMCHGPEGKFVGGAIPPLAGYPADVMAQQLKAFKTGERPSTIMGRHMKGYTDAEIDEIAAYFGTLKP